MKNWKTTLLGICTVLTALASAGKLIAAGNIAAVDWTTTGTAVSAGIGLIFAQDSKPTAPTDVK